MPPRTLSDSEAVYSGVKTLQAHFLRKADVSGVLNMRIPQRIQNDDRILDSKASSQLKTGDPKRSVIVECRQTGSNPCSEPKYWSSVLAWQAVA